MNNTTGLAMRATLTDQIIASLEKGVEPWFKPWTGSPISRPLRVNGQPYQGINVLRLWITSEIENYSSPYWMTYRQANELGGQVRKGQKGTDVIYNGKVTMQKGTDDERNISVMRSYVVFNTDQIDNLPEKYSPKPIANKPITNGASTVAAESFFVNLVMDLRHGGDRAFYHSTEDYVQLPEFNKFHTPTDYYCTLGHESIHWTKAKNRLDRDLNQKRGGDEGYAMEELVAELGSAYLAADLGIAAKPRKDHANYIATWLSMLRDDKRAIFTAASYAEKAIGYLRQLQPGYIADGEP